MNCVFTKHLQKDYPSHLRVSTMSQNCKLFFKRLSQCSKLPNILPRGHNRHVTVGFFAATVWKGSIYNAFKNMNSTPRSWRSGWLTGSAQNSFCGREKWRCIFIRCSPSPSPGPGRPSAAHSTPVLWLVTPALTPVFQACDTSCRLSGELPTSSSTNAVYLSTWTRTMHLSKTIQLLIVRTQGYTPPVGHVKCIFHKVNV